MTHTDPLHPRHKLPYFNNGLTDCHEIWHNDAVWLSASYLPLKFEYLVIQYGGWPPFWKFENRHISATEGPIATKFSVMTQIPVIDALQPIGNVSWRLSNLWTQCDIYVCRGMLSSFEKSTGEDLSCYLNKIESIGLRKA